MRDVPAIEVAQWSSHGFGRDSTMIGDLIAVVLLVGGYSVIAVLGARAVLRDELTRRRSRPGGPGPSVIGR